MNQHERDLYRAVCKADPECRSGLVYYGGKFGDNDDENDPVRWRHVGYADWPVLPELADAAIRDHLHTRLAFWHRFFVQAEPNVDRVLVWVAGEHGPTPRGHYIGPSKLSALLVAHAARLGVPVPKEIDDDPLV